MAVAVDVSPPPGLEEAKTMNKQSSREQHLLTVMMHARNDPSRQAERRPLCCLLHTAMHSI